MNDLTKFYRIRKTCLQMLNDRNYLVSNEDLNGDQDAFREQFGDTPSKEQLTILVPKQDDPVQKMFVFFPEEAKVGVKTIKNLTDRMRDEAVSRAIMVIAQNLTPFAKQTLDEIKPAFTIEQFTENELLVNITKHVLVPEHRILSAEEKAVLLQRYKVKETQLPRIQHSDPVARYYGLQKGEVVRIVRPSETAGRYVTYRFCL